MYNEAESEDDMLERYEDMSRMREHLYGEVDVNKDGLISYEEFMEYSKSSDFDEDEAWDVSAHLWLTYLTSAHCDVTSCSFQTVDDDEIYTEEELMAFEDELSQRMMGHAQPGEINVS